MDRIARIALLTLLTLVLFECSPGAVGPSSASTATSKAAPSASLPTSTNPSAQPHTVPAGTVHYVSKNGSNADGHSWATAWNELDQIDWSVVQPGDTIYLDGGAARMTYTTQLRPGRSGTASAPITIQLAPDAGHNGQVEMFGGRNILLPDCHDPNYVPQTSGVIRTGLELENVSYITVDGTKWSGIILHAFGSNGVALSANSTGNTIRYMEVYDNGDAVWTAQGWYNPDYPGVALRGTNQTFEYDLIHDNGQDPMQSSGGLGNIAIRNSWLYNARPSASDPNAAFNGCMHSDATQVYDGGDQYGFTVENSILGPGLLQGLYLTEGGGYPNMWATFHNVTVRNTLMYKETSGTVVASAPHTTPTNWNFDHVTTWRTPHQLNHNFLIQTGTGMNLTNSIVYGGAGIFFPSGTTFSNNFMFDNGGTVIGPTIDPLFRRVSTGMLATDDDFTPTNAQVVASGAGSSIHSVADLIATGNGGTGSTPTPAATHTAVAGSPTAQPSATRTRTAVPQPTVTGTHVGGATTTPVTTRPPVTATSTSIPAASPTDTSTPAPGQIFSDVIPADYFYTAVNWLANHQIISGYSDGTFRPYNNTTRAQLSKIAVLAEGWPVDTSGGPHFSDVPTSNPFYQYVETAYHHNTVSGYADGTFRWARSVTRAQLSKMIVEAQEWAIDTSGGPHFSDVPTSNPFYQYVETAYHHLVISGYSNGTFRPGSMATRGQIAKIVYEAISAP